MDADGTVNFRDDIYKRDGVLWAALNRQPEDREAGLPLRQLTRAADWELVAELPTRSEPAPRQRE